MRYDILGVQFDNVTLPEAVETATRFLDSEGAHIVVTPNAEIVFSARGDEAMRDLLNASDLVLPDGIGVVRASAILGDPIRERVAGIDFAQTLLPVLAARRDPVFFLGAAPGVAQEAASRMTQAHPGLWVCGVQDGYFQAAMQDEVLSAIRNSGARAVFVCLGSPRQEQFMHRFGVSTGARLLVGLGGTFDVWSGQSKRAPGLFIRLGLEWLYRLIRQPSRIVRMMKLPAFLWTVHRSKNKRNKR